VNCWDRDVGILGQSGNFSICFDVNQKHFCVINLNSNQIYRKVHLEGVPSSLIDIKLIN
jgi:hypothetical protein